MLSRLVKSQVCALRNFKALQNKFQMNFAVVRKFTKEHEWIDYDEEAKTGTIGITAYAAQELGDIVHIEFPDVGTKFKVGESIGSIESVKVAADVYAPVDGEIEQINEIVNEDPALVNQDPSLNWFLKLKVANEAQIRELFTEKQYQRFLEDLKSGSH
ncbi:hypothetical protein ABPG74_004157 [Tetrahymena malaccensis]